MSGAAIRRSRRIEFADTDASGRAHHAALMRHVEAVEHELLGRLGIPVISPGGGWPRVRIEADFRAPLAAGDQVDVVVEAGSVGRSAVEWSFRVEGADGKPAAEGRIVSVWVGPDGRAMTIPGEWRSALAG